MRRAVGDVATPSADRKRAVGHPAVVAVLVGKAVHVWGDRWIRFAVAVVAFAAVIAVTCLIADPRMFTGFASYDDEGYLLIALRGFVSHGSLYDQIFTRYGPFYYEVWGGLFSLFGIPIGHDGGRAVTIVVWIAISLTIGLATMRMAGSLVLGLAVQMLVFSALVVLTNEPMHPGGLICLLLVAIVALAGVGWGRVAPYAMAALGGALAALLLVKVNVGCFALASVALACLVSHPALARRRWLRPAVEVAFLATPALVMLGNLDAPWVRQYALHVSVAALAVVVVLRARSRERRPGRELGWLLAGFVVVAAAASVGIVALGTSPGGLVDGVLREPLHQADAFTLPLRLPEGWYAIDLLALGGAAAYWYASARRARIAGLWRAATALLTVAVGLLMALSVAGDAFRFDPGGFKGYPLSMLAFSWVALVAAPPGDRPGVAFARVLLPLLAVLQALHAFPVAGSQILWASFLLVPIGAICIADGVRGLASALASDAARRVLTGLVGVGAAVLLWFVVDATLRAPLPDARAAYDFSVPLNLPGARAVRVDMAEAELYRQISAAIRRNCPAVVMLPGMDSFYLWAEQEPPTGENANNWPTVFDDAQQRRVIADTRSIKGLCLLQNPELAAFWSAGRTPSGPLVRYMQRGFRPIASFGAYELLKRAKTRA